MNVITDLNQLNALTPTNSQKVCLETSFASLQSPGIGEPYPLMSGTSSKTSSMAGSLFSRSQLNSILQYDGNGSIFDDSFIARSTSAGPSEATTVLLDSASTHYRGKSVAFDIGKGSHPSTSSPSPNILPKSILHRQIPGVAIPKKPSTLSFSEPMNNGDVQKKESRKIDFAHDDWYGMAPLASPETLSEISSISSRTSLAMNLASSIEKYLHRVTATNNYDYALTANDIFESELNESQLVTPKVMRRTPKIAGNLSTCADDWQSVDKYKRMGKVFITNPVPLLHSDSSGDSFESTHSLTKSKCCVTPTTTTENSKSADNLDDSTATVTSHSTKKLTMSDSAILNDSCSSTCPKCPCKHSTSSLQFQCCRKRDHSDCMDQRFQTPNTSSTSDTYHSALSSFSTIEPLHFSPRNSTRLPSGVLESHFPVYMEASTNESTSLLSKIKSPKILRRTDKNHGSNGNGNGNDTKFGRTTKIYGDDRFFSRNESLPLLSNLVEKSSPSSFARRKNYAVYPMTSSPRQSPSKKTESNV